MRRISYLVAILVGLGLTASGCAKPEPADAPALRERLARAPFVELADEPDTLGPVRSASRETVLVGAIEPASPAADAFRIWAVMDHLTRGGALNALEIAEAVLAD